MQIRVYGPGCSNCQKLYERARKAVEEMELDGELVKVEDINQMITAGVVRTPALGFDEELISQGIIPDSEQIQKWLQLYLHEKSVNR